MNKLTHKLAGYRDVLTHVIGNTNGVYGDYHFAWGNTNDLKRRVKGIETALVALEASQANLDTLIKRIKDPNGIPEMRAYYSASKRPAVNMTEANEKEVMAARDAHLRMDPIVDSDEKLLGKIKGDNSQHIALGNGIEPPSTTPADYTTRFIPNQVKTPSFLAKDAIVPVAIFESVNKEKTFSKQIIVTQDIKRLNKAPKENLWEFAQQLVDTAKASVKSGPITIGDNWPVKLGAAVAAYCAYKNYQCDAPAKYKKNLASDVEKIGGHLRTTMSGKKLSELARATDTEPFAKRPGPSRS